jgi:hypothetical protein
MKPDEERERVVASVNTTTNLDAEASRLLGNCWQQHHQVCLEQPPLPFA